MSKTILPNSPLILNLLLEEDSQINNIQEKLGYIEVFARDTLENFFCEYDEVEKNKDIDTLRVMLHNAQSYKKYLLVIIDYLNQMKRSLHYTNNLVSKTLKQLMEDKYNG